MIHIHGYLGEIQPASRDLAERCALVLGGRRHLDALGVPEERRVVLGPLGPALERLHQLPEGEDALVLASGDPGFHGVLRRLRLEGFEVKVLPAVSSVAAAFARVALPWDDAVMASAHGQPLETALQACRENRKVAVLTGRGEGIAEIATALADIERTYVLAERLGEDDERLRILTGEQARALTDVLDPHVVLVLDGSPDDPSLIARPAPEPETANEHAGLPDQAEDRFETDDQAPIIGQLVNSAAARRHADQIDHALGIVSRRYDGMVGENLPTAWQECDLLVSHLALGATTRLLAPLLADKKADPGVVVVDEAGRFAVPLVGGHAGGANDLARRIAEGIGATAVLTTATDALNLPALDTLGWPYSGDVAGVTRAIIDERPVLVEKAQPWPMPPLPATVSTAAADPVARIVVTDQTVVPPSDLPTVVLHPKSLVVGMGCNRGTPVETLRELLEQTLAENHLALESVAAITTVDLKAGEIGLLQLVHQLGVPLVDFTPEELAAQEVPTPSDLVRDHVGTPSVAEASVLARGARLLVPKQHNSDATCAIGRLPARGRLSVVGLGPGSRDLLTPRAIEHLRQATFIVGYGPYVKQIRDLARPGTRIMASKMGTEEARTAAAIEAARQGENVALVCGGDPAIYAMASPVLEQGTDGIEVQIVPGVTAELAVSAILGAPLGHDHATISLSDLHTDWNDIERRLQAAAEGDLVTALYNPRSRSRTRHLPRALEIMAGHRPPTTPVAVVQQACRPRQKVVMSTLAEFQPEWVDMNSLVVIGSSTTRFVTTGDGERRIVTPRDYHWMPATDTETQEVH
ncbi:precorrin-3B C(17)-methyltransferase [Aestuariimicrobium sp. p3-SID1156]|uniref:precorrin-3B C(17)-methyltransferase n=1 Tax=Aestuariimicrobium sp. p3-SID1156 TaxID=2916038 RepID=UPI00223AEB8A|nr:precorrin-3B C(17)-methyltransferase [Aestuariimicrobium sp. p3-SID1156]MCT1458627.1 precorrin-3B C(17)-methyltransferase [Aestuariimicrobium sp. p3-SID1156]